MLHYVVGIVVLLSLSHPRFSESSICCFNDQTCPLTPKDMNVVIQKVSANTDSALVLCPDLQGEGNVTVTLSKQTVLHSTVFNRTQQLNKEFQQERFRLFVNYTRAHYMIDRPGADDMGLYCCTVSTGPNRRTNNIYLFVKDPDPPEPWTELVLSAGCGLLALYSLIVTMVTGSFAWKLKCVETLDQNDYINTKLGEFRRAK